MTRILVPRGSSGSASSSSNQNRPSAAAAAAASSAPSSSSSTPAPTQLQGINNNHNLVASALKDDEHTEEAPEQIIVDDCSEYCGAFGGKGVKIDDLSPESLSIDQKDDIEKISQNEMPANNEFMSPGDLVKGVGGLSVVEEENEGLVGSSLQAVTGSSCPPPPPVPPPRLSSNLRRSTSGSSNSVRIGPSRRAAGWVSVPARTSPTDSRPSSPRSHCETEGYNSADEQNPCYGSSYDDSERECQFELDIRRAKGLEVRKMVEDGNCLFRAVADQVYGDSEAYDLVRQMCIDYMERERDHFSQFITEGFTSYCKRKRRDKVYGNNVEIQALSEMYNRPIHIYSYSTEPINIFHGSYNTDTPIRLSYHHGNHYNSLVDPRRLTIGAGLGFSCLRGTNVDRDQVKAAIRAQQDQQLDNALLAEGRFYSDLELTEKEIERMVMEASRAEYLASDNFKQQIAHRDSSTSGAEPSSSGARPSISESKKEVGHEFTLQDSVLSSSMQIVLSMGFSYLQAIEAYSIFGDDVDSMVCYLLETSSTGRRKGKATE